MSGAQQWQRRLGEILRQARRDCGMSQSDAAEEIAKLGVLAGVRARSQQTVSNWETAWATPSVKELRALVRIYGMDPHLLVEILVLDDGGR